MRGRNVHVGPIVVSKPYERLILHAHLWQETLRNRHIHKSALQLGACSNHGCTATQIMLTSALLCTRQPLACIISCQE